MYDFRAFLEKGEGPQAKRASRRGSLRAASQWYELLWSMMDLDGEKYSSHVTTDFTEVERLLKRDVPLDERPRFQAQLDAVAPYIKDRTRPLVARVQLAMLYVAKGDFNKLVSARELADIDWRDLLMQAEYPSTPSFNDKKEETPREHNERILRDRKAVEDWRRET